MSDSPRHNVGSIADPHWVVDEEHYLKAVADADHFFVCWQDTLEQRDKLAAALAHLQSFVRGDLQEYDAAEVASLINEALKECGK